MFLLFFQRLSHLFLISLFVALFPPAALAVDAVKTLRVAFPNGETRFDPGVEADQASLSICENIFESLLKYDYLARPVKLIPNTAESLPEIRDSGTTYIINIKPGIYFTPDKAFEGKRRELTASDYIYSLKRILDPNVRSQWEFLLRDKLLGSENKQFNYDSPWPGLILIDRYTFKIRLKKPDYNLLYILAMPATGALAREVVEKYRDDVGAHPVGTGPFMLAEWKRRNKIVLVANPDFRDTYLNIPSTVSDQTGQQIIRDIANKKLPIIKRIEVSIIEEEQPRWLAFLNADFDYINPIPRDFADIAMPLGKVSPNLKNKGIYAVPDEEAYTTYTMFNMKDEIIGGYSTEKIALRRAMAMAYDVKSEISLIKKNQAVVADSPIPPGLAGHDQNFRNPVNIYNPSGAKALLDMFEYKDKNHDGYRELPNGQPFSIELSSTPSLISRQLDELWKKNMDLIGIRLTFNKAPLPELRNSARIGKLQMFSYGWIGDYPDGENFLQLLYSKNIGQINYAQFNLPAYDKIYEDAKQMPDSITRTKLYNQLNKYIAVYAPWRVGVYPRQHHLLHPWIKGYKKHPMQNTPWLYLDVAPHKNL